jgi:hypothetical protein
MFVSFLVYSLILKMEAIYFSETLVAFQLRIVAFFTTTAVRTSEPAPAFGCVICYKLAGFRVTVL